MPRPYGWKLEEDEYLAQAVCAGLFYDEIAARLGRSRSAIIERRKKLRVERPLEAPPPAPVNDPIADAPRTVFRTALPAGDPITWGAITAGTWLEGAPYPLETSWMPSR